MMAEEAVVIDPTTAAALGAAEAAAAATGQQQSEVLVQEAPPPEVAAEAGVVVDQVNAGAIAAAAAAVDAAGAVNVNGSAADPTDAAAAPPHTTTTTTTLTITKTTEEGGGGGFADDEDIEGDPNDPRPIHLQHPLNQDKRRFFPRVKHLLSREWAYFLSGVLDALDQAGAPACAAAAHKDSNPWYKAFDLVYGGVAADCSIPTGKNRYHKFKDKIVELWIAMEQQGADDHPLKERAILQLSDHREACEESLKNGGADMGWTATGAGGGGSIKPSSEKRPAKGSAAAKRGYTASIKWKYLEEADVIKKLPQPLQNLLHLRHLSSEIKAHSTVEIQYQKALAEYLKEDCAKDAAYDKSLALACLWRQAQSAKEAKEIQEVYERAVSDYLAYIDPSAVTV